MSRARRRHRCCLGGWSSCSLLAVINSDGCPRHVKRPAGYAALDAPHQERSVRMVPRGTGQPGRRGPSPGDGTAWLPGPASCCYHSQAGVTWVRFGPGAPFHTKELSGQGREGRCASPVPGQAGAWALLAVISCLAAAPGHPSSRASPVPFSCGNRDAPAGRATAASPAVAPCRTMILEALHYLEIRHA